MAQQISGVGLIAVAINRAAFFDLFEPWQRHRRTVSFARSSSINTTLSILQVAEDVEAQLQLLAER